MSFCAAVGCSNSSKNCTGKGISFFSLPREKSIRNAWIAAIKRTKLPKNVYVCSEHFTDECFESVYRLQAEMLSPSKRKKKQLIPGSIPSVFKHKAAVKKRIPVTEKREQSVLVKQVSLLKV